MYALVYYPQIEDASFQKLRFKWEPYASLIEEHLTLIFPVDESVGLSNLDHHINSVLANWKPFTVRFNGLETTEDHWLFLMVADGNNNLVKLHDELYSGILAPYLREDLPYSPHVGLGHFAYETYDLHNPLARLTLDEKKYTQGYSEFEALNMNYIRTIDKLVLVQLNDDLTTCVDVKSYLFG